MLSRDIYRTASLPASRPPHGGTVTIAPDVGFSTLNRFRNGSLRGGAMSPACAAFATLSDEDSSLTITLSEIQAAAAAIAGQVARTPLTLSRTLSELTGAEVWLKFENMQFTASFKERGALNAMLRLGPEQMRRGVITMSAGNHAQAVAYHARRLGIAATIVMPRGTPLIKVIQTESHAARVLLEGDDLASAAAQAHRLEAEQNLCFIHPYDDGA